MPIRCRIFLHSYEKGWISIYQQAFYRRSMSDTYTPQQRHENMAAIHGKNTKPEVVVRKWLWIHGYRYRLNHPRLPGKPDIVMRKYRTCIFVNGCFWHGHEGCRYYTIPKTNTEFWINKIRRNQERDREVCRKLALMGWHCITIWECELKSSQTKNDTLESPDIYTQ